MTATAGPWPGAASCAAAFTFDFAAEDVWLAEDPANASRPGVLSQGTYGAKVAMPRLLELLGRHGITATFFVPGRVAERYPGQVAAAVAAGHELAHHGYTHTPPAALSREEEEQELIKGRQALEVFGTEVRGYRAPSWDISTNTLRLLHEHGFIYSSNLMDDIHPYRHADSSVVEVPVHWTLDDAAHFWFAEASWTKTIATTAAVRTVWEEEFLGIRKMGGACVFAIHPQIIGRPGRLTFLDEFMAFVTSHDDVWIATAREIATRFLSPRRLVTAGGLIFQSAARAGTETVLMHLGPTKARSAHSMFQPFQGNSGSNPECDRSQVMAPLDTSSIKCAKFPVGSRS